MEIKSTVLNNGNTSKFFKLECGVRQECPLSAFIFTISLIILAHKVRNDENIKGIKIDNKEIKISLLVDDITPWLGVRQMFHQSTETIPPVLWPEYYHWQNTSKVYWFPYK